MTKFSVFLTKATNSLQIARGNTDTFILDPFYIPDPLLYNIMNIYSTNQLEVDRVGFRVDQQQFFSLVLEW